MGEQITYEIYTELAQIKFGTAVPAKNDVEALNTYYTDLFECILARQPESFRKYLLKIHQPNNELSSSPTRTIIADFRCSIEK
jgi:hypothetical protein